MDCKDVAENIGAMIDNALEERVAEQLRKHLFRCADCRRLYEEELQLWRLLNVYHGIEPSEEFIKAVMQRIHKERLSLRRVVAVISAVAAVILLSVFLITSPQKDVELSLDSIAEILQQEELLANIELAEEWEVAALMDFLASVDDVELESE